ncbi:MAG: hypothetical protein IPK26_30065 [Planctomycetes bacterium]|nr:hypothetical protein [Planctomycetota bacterium]
MSTNRCKGSPACLLSGDRSRIGSLAALWLGMALGGDELAAQATRFTGHDVGPYAAGLVQKLAAATRTGELVRASRDPAAAAGSAWGASFTSRGCLGLALVLDLGNVPIGTSLFVPLRGVRQGVALSPLDRTRIARDHAGWRVRPIRPAVQANGVSVVLFARNQIVGQMDFGPGHDFEIELPPTAVPDHLVFEPPSSWCRTSPRWWWTPPFPDPSVGESFVFQQEVPITVDTQPPIHADMVRIISRDLVPVTAFDQVSVFTTSDTMSHFDIVDAGSAVAGFGVTTVGTGNLALVHGQDLQVQNLQAPGDGIAIDFGRARCAMFDLPIGLPIDSGDRFELTVLGARGGQSGQELGRLAFTREGNATAIRQDFSAVFGTAPVVADIFCYSGGVEVARVASRTVNPDEPVVRDGYIIHGDIIIIVDYKQGEDDHPGSILSRGLFATLDFGAAAQFEIAVGNGQFQMVTAEQVVLRYRVSPTAMDWVEGMTLANSNWKANPGHLVVRGLGVDPLPTLFVGAAAGTLPGAPLTVNGSIGGLGRRVTVLAGQPVQIDSTAPATFLLAGFGVPGPQQLLGCSGSPFSALVFDQPLTVGLLQTMQLPHPGFGLELVLQGATIDGSQPCGIGLTNAVLIEVSTLGTAY